MAPCTPGSEQLQSSAAPVVNNKWALSARSTGPRTPKLLPAPLLPPSPRAAQAPLQYPPGLPTRDGHPEVREHARPLLHEVGWAGSITRGGEQGRFGGGRKASLGLSCLKLPPGICKVLLQGERSDGSRCKTCQASKIFQPAQAESWLSFQQTSANS